MFEVAKWVLMGAAHTLIFWPWGIALSAIGLRKLLGLPARVGVLPHPSRVAGPH